MKQPLYLAPRARQQGVALVVVLVLLLVMTLLGLASLRGTLLEERMSANLYDRSLSFQAAEAAVREAEARLNGVGVLATFPAAGCNDGLCATPIAADGVKERWQDPKPAYWKSAAAVTGTAAAPEYFVEYMGMAPSWIFCDSEEPVPANCLKPRYRITARSRAADRAEVVLQTSYAAL